MLGGGRAIRYGVRVGRDGFTWNGVQKITRKAEWPDWHPPTEMIERQPYLPRFMAGGPGNPLGARAMYLGCHRLSHPRHQPALDDRQVRLVGLHRHAERRRIDLFDRTKVGTRVVVMPGGPPPGRDRFGAPSACARAGLERQVRCMAPTEVPPLPAPVTVRCRPSRDIAARRCERLR